MMILIIKKPKADLMDMKKPLKTYIGFFPGTVTFIVVVFVGDVDIVVVS